MLTMSRKTFRFLILLSWVLAAACVVLWFVETRHLPPELRSYMDRDIDAPLTVGDFVALGYLLFLLALSVVASVGLYKFRSWGRSLYLFTFAVSFVPLPPFEPHVETTFSTYAAYLSSALAGFLLALVYFSPLGQYFEPRGGVSGDAAGA